MNNEQIVKFIAQNMEHIGWSQWLFAVKRVKKLDNAFAEIVPEEISKQVVFSISDKFMKLPEDRQKSILCHEFIHARVLMKETKVERYCEEIKNHEEELMVNDIEHFVMNRQLEVAEE